MKKQPYQKPVLKRYGSVVAQTMAVASTSMVSDGGTGLMNKTS